MNKSTKLTSSLLAGALLLVNGAPFVNPIVAKDAPMVSVENQNNNVSAQLVEQDGKNYLSVLAHNDVTNVSVKVKVSNGQVITFKQASLKANETVMFELNIKDVEAVKAAKAKSNKKSLPKTEIVRESLLLQGKLKGFDLNAVVSYDVEKAVPVLKAELKQTNEVKTKETKSDVKTDKESKKSEVEIKADQDTKDSVSHTNPIEEKAPKVEEGVKVELVEKKDEVSLDELEKMTNNESTQPVVKETPKEDKPIIEETPKVEDKVETPKKDPRMDADIIVDTNNTADSESFNPFNTVETKNVEVAPKEATVFKLAPKGSYTKVKVNATLQGSYDEVVAQEVFNQLNAHRVKHGLKPLSVAVELSAGTEVRAKEFAQKALSGKSGMSLHTRLDESHWYTAFGGYGNAKGENVAYSVHGSSGMMGFWKNSKVHNDNMLNPKYTKVLVKVFKHGSTYYGVQIFG